MVRLMVMMIVVLGSLIVLKNPEFEQKIFNQKYLQQLITFISQSVLDFLPEDVKVNQEVNYTLLKNDYYQGTSNQVIAMNKGKVIQVQKQQIVILDENGYLHIKKTSSNVGESYKTYIIANDFGKTDYKNMFQQTAAKMKTIFKTFGKEVPDIINKEKMLELCSEIICSEESYVIEEHELKGSMLKEIIKPLYPQFSLFLADTNLDTSTSSFQKHQLRIRILKT